MCRSLVPAGIAEILVLSPNPAENGAPRGAQGRASLGGGGRIVGLPGPSSRRSSRAVASAKRCARSRKEHNDFVINHARHTTDALLQVKDGLEQVCRRLNGLP